MNRTTGRLFGTDGVRGVANRELTPELAMRIGRAVAFRMTRDGGKRGPIALAYDGRISGPMLGSAMVAGVTSIGCDAIYFGILPTPGLACLVPSLGAACGIMVSASHNPIEDNGIKLFGPDGYKTSDALEREIEAIITAEDNAPRPVGLGVGRVHDGIAERMRYVERLVENGGELKGWTIVVDAAFGAAYEVAPMALRRLGAEVVTLHGEPDGARINVGCGATHIEPLRKAVEELAQERPDSRVVGVAFDGDADRALFIDEGGKTITGDHVLWILARKKKSRGELARDTVVGTSMTNVGLERALRSEGIALARAEVGDRAVLEEMRNRGSALGAEPSGHVIDFARMTTGDGPMIAVTLFSLAARSGSLHDLADGFELSPQLIRNVRTERKVEILAMPAVQNAIADAKVWLGERGRIVVRASGTEPLIRVMVEGDDAGEIAAVADGICARIREAEGVESESSTDPTKSTEPKPETAGKPL